MVLASASVTTKLEPHIGDRAWSWFRCIVCGDRWASVFRGWCEKTFDGTWYLREFYSWEFNFIFIFLTFFQVVLRFWFWQHNYRRYRSFSRPIGSQHGSAFSSTVSIYPSSLLAWVPGSKVSYINDWLLFQNLSNYRLNSYLTLQSIRAKDTKLVGDSGLYIIHI